MRLFPRFGRSLRLVAIGPGPSRPAATRGSHLASLTTRPLSAKTEVWLCQFHCSVGMAIPLHPEHRWRGFDVVRRSRPPCARFRSGWRVKIANLSARCALKLPTLTTARRTERNKSRVARRNPQIARNVKPQVKSMLAALWDDHPACTRYRQTVWLWISLINANQ